MNAKTRIRWLALILLLQAAVIVTLVSVAYLKRASLRSAISWATPPGARVPTIIKKLDFMDQSSLKDWEEKVFKGKTVFTVLKEDQFTYLNSKSANASSGLYRRFELEPTEDLVLSWRWKPISFPKKKNPEKLANRSEDDFAARVYVIFPGSTFFNTDVIEYIWDESIAEGTVGSSPYSDRVKLFVIRSGRPTEENGGWQIEKRSPYEDYVKLFGKKPKRAIGAVALMSDSDNTGTQSEANFGAIVFKIEKKDALPNPQSDGKEQV